MVATAAITDPAEGHLAGGAHELCVLSPYTHVAHMAPFLPGCPFDMNKGVITMAKATHRIHYPP